MSTGQQQNQIEANQRRNGFGTPYLG
jgi:hypothetical protein